MSEIVASLTLTGDWNGFQENLSPTGAARLRRNMAIATQRNARLLVKFMRRLITEQQVRGGGTSFTPNAKLTRYIKRSSKPLMHTAQMARSITWRSFGHDDLSAWVGLPTLGPRNAYRIAHNGGQIPVTFGMRRMFWALYQATRKDRPWHGPIQLRGRALEIALKMRPGVTIFPIGRGTTRLYVPGRPFMLRALFDTEFQRQAIANWQRAVEKTFGRSQISWS